MFGCIMGSFEFKRLVFIFFIFYSKSNFSTSCVYLGLYFIYLLLKWAFVHYLQCYSNGQIRMKRVLKYCFKNSLNMRNGKEICH